MPIEALEVQLLTVTKAYVFTVWFYDSLVCARGGTTTIYLKDSYLDSESGFYQNLIHLKGYNPSFTSYLWWFYYLLRNALNELRRIPIPARYPGI